MIGTVTIIGGIAAVLSTVSFMPQVIKIIRSRDTEGISTGMYVVTVIGFAMWIAYGALQSAWPLIASNSVCLILSTFILTMKLLSPEKKEDDVDAHRRK